MITIQGLSNKQVALADIMWAISTREGVENFISTLPKVDQRDCRTIIELMQLAFLDEIENVDTATKLLSKYNRK